MDYTRMRNATRYRIQRARRLRVAIKQHYAVGHYSKLVNVARQLSQINFLREQAL